MGSATLGHSPDVRNLPDDCSMRSSQTVSKVDNRCASHHQEPIMKNSRLSTAAAVLTLLGASAAFAEPPPTGAIKNVVVVHGALADGSGWRAVSDILTRDGYNVTIVQDPQTTLAEDVAATDRILAQQDGPTILVGHSYGGTVITQAGANPKVAALVYVAAVVPEVGESTAQLAMSIPAASNDIHPTADGFLFLDPSKFAADFAADVSPATANFMARSQVPVSGAAFTTAVTTAAWHNKPNYGVVPTADRILNPDLERSLYKRAGAKVTEVNGASHAVFLSHAKIVADRGSCQSATFIRNTPGSASRRSFGSGDVSSHVEYAAIRSWTSAGSPDNGTSSPCRLRHGRGVDGGMPSRSPKPRPSRGGQESAALFQPPHR
jgi:pimeloyl-ACP methyl ester carboxylesterase